MVQINNSGQFSKIVEFVNIRGEDTVNIGFDGALSAGEEIAIQIVAEEIRKSILKIGGK